MIHLITWSLFCRCHVASTVPVISLPRVNQITYNTPRERGGSCHSGSKRENAPRCVVSHPRGFFAQVRPPWQNRGREAARPPPLQQQQQTPAEDEPRGGRDKEMKARPRPLQTLSHTVARFRNTIIDIFCYSWYKTRCLPEKENCLLNITFVVSVNELQTKDTSALIGSGIIWPHKRCGIPTKALFDTHCIRYCKR